MTTSPFRRATALLTSGALVIAACGGDDATGTSQTEAPATGTEGAAGSTTAEPTEPESSASMSDEESDGTAAPTDDAASTPAMRLTLELNPDAVWEDGSPIGVADFQCTLDASLNTPGSLVTVGYDQITSITEGADEHEVVIDFATVYAPYKNLFNPILKADRHDDCNDVSLDFEERAPDSARPYRVDSWSPTQLVLVPNEHYFGTDTPEVDRVVMVPLTDSDTEIAALKAGDVDFIYPQFFAGIVDALADPNVAVKVEYGGDYEALFFQQLDGPFADDVFREAFVKSIDRNALFQQIYSPIDPNGTVLDCGPIVPGKYCDPADPPFTDEYDPAAAASLLEGAGWSRNADGMWQDASGNVPRLRWMVNTGNTRRESTQAYLIPLMQDAGFDLVADNCDAACIFQQRLPALDYDLGMYISTAAPDPAYLTTAFTCASIPSEENNFTGANQQGWCNEEASQLLEQADRTVDEQARAELVKRAIAFTASDHVMVPLFQFPKSGAYRTDRVGPTDAVEGEIRNFRAFENVEHWEDLDGDGQIVIGAEQWPECLNPITECANSSWYAWTVSFPIQPGVFDTTNALEYVPTNIVVGEPTVEVFAGG